MQSYAIQQSTANQPLLFLLVSSTDHISPLTGATPTVVLSKNGGTFASPAGAVSEVGNGLYKVAPNATDSGTLGPLSLHATATGADPTDVVFPVVAFNPLSATNLGLSALPTANPGAAGGVFIAGSNAATTANFTGSLSGSVGSVTGAVGSVTGAVGSVAGNVGGNVVGSVGSVAGAVGSVTGNVGGSVASVTGAVGSVAGNVGGNVAGSVASVTAAVTVGGYSTGQDPATLVLDVAAPGHDTAGTIGAAINASGSASDPLANAVPGSYASGTAGFILGTNLNAAVSAVKARTDSLPASFPGNFPSLAISSSGRVAMDTSVSLSPPREITGVPTGQLTINDALWGAVVIAAGAESWTASGGTVSIPANNQVYRTFSIETTPTTATRS